MSKAVPSKMLAMAETMGADAFRDITVERVKLQPIGVNAATSYTPNALNKIHFRIPAYSASFLDNSRTFLSFTVQTTGDDLTATHCAVFGNGLPVFNRMVVKSSNGLVLEDCSQFHLLTRLFTILSTEEDYRIQEGVYSDGDPTVTVGAQLLTGLKYTIQFNSGLLDKKLKSFLPLFMMDSSYALDVELYLSSPAECLRLVGSGGTTPTNVSFSLTNPIMNLCLLKMDNQLCSRFNSIACDPNESIVIPFTTYRCHVHTLSSQTSVVHINDASTNVKRIWSVYTPVSQTVSNALKLPFKGSAKQASAAEKIISYNYRLGNQFLFNESVVETTDNKESLFLVKDAVWSTDKPMMLSKNESLLVTNFESASKQMFFTVANMTYSSEETRGVVQGTSSAIPIELNVSFAGTPTLLVNNFIEAGFNLVIKNGQIRYEEKLGGSNKVY
jgi:sulfur relay (sulfurtransferase) complex TusBCD TusD component (DsrE family)